MASGFSLRAVLSLDTKEMSKGLTSARKSIQTFAKDANALGLAIAGSLVAAGTATLGLVANFAEASREFGGLKKQLESTFNSAQIEGISGALKDLQGTKVQGEDIVESLRRIGGQAKNTQQAVRDFQIALDLATISGETLPTVAEAIQKIGIDPAVGTKFFEDFNLNIPKLISYGAQLNKTKDAFDTTGANAEKLRIALRRVAEEDSGNAFEATLTVTEEFNRELFNLRAELGEPFASPFVALTEGATIALEGFRNLNKIVGNTGGILVALAAGTAVAIGGITSLAIVVGTSGGAAAFAAMTTKVVGLYSALSVTTALETARTGFIALRAAAVSTTAALGLTLGALTAIGAAAVVLQLETNNIKAQTAANEELLAIDLRRAESQRSINSLLGKSVQQLQAQKVTADQLALAGDALRERFATARDAGNTQLAEQIKNQIIELKGQKESLARAETAATAFSDPAAVKKREEEAKQRLADKKAREQAEKDRIAARKAADEELARKQEEAARKQLEIELSSIELALAQRKISELEAIKLKEETLKRFKNTEAELRSIAIQTAQIEIAAREEVAKKSADASLKLLERNKQQIAAIQQQPSTSTGSLDEVQRLDEELKVFKKIEAEKLALIQRRQQVQLRATSDPIAKIELEAIDAALVQFKSAEAEKVQILQARKDKIQEIANVEASLAQQERQAQRADIDQTVGQLQSQTETRGTDNQAKIKAALTERLNLSLEQIRLEAEVAKAASDSAQQTALIEADAQRKIRNEILSTAQTERDAIAQQIKTLGDLKKARLDSVSTSSDPFDISQLSERLKQERATTSRLRTPDSLPAINSQIQSLASSIASQQSAAQSRTAQQIGVTPEEFKGNLDVKIGIEDGRAVLKSVSAPGINGKYTEIERSAKSVRGTVSIP